MKKNDEMSVTIHHSPRHKDANFPYQHLKTLIPRLLEKKALSFPLVECIVPQEPGDFFSIHAIADATQELINSPSDLLSFTIPSGVIFSSFSTQRIHFTLDASPDHVYLFFEVKGLVEDLASCVLLQEQSEKLGQAITFALEYPTASSHLASPSLRAKASLVLRQGLLERLLRRNKKKQTVLMEELQRFLLATDETYKTLRSQEHLLKLVVTHHFLKEQFPLQSKKEKQLFFKVFPSKLLFAFGSKEVLSLVVSLRALSRYEHFDQRHLVQACKRCIPSLEMVPESFYSYSYANESTLSLYVEVAKIDGSRLTRDEYSLLKKELERELPLAIEHVVTRIDIPPNEDDVLRNILLLSQEIKNVRSPPQVIIQFHEQNDTLLTFHVTLVQLVKKEDEPILFPSAPTSDIVRFLPLTASLLDKLRNKYQKKSLTFLVQCTKDSFLRHDHSIDFLRAREAVHRGIEEVFGRVRDLNGGLIYQQNKLLERVKTLLSEEEAKELFFIEKLFHSLSPSLMKNLLGPEHILTVFRQLRSLQKTSKLKSSTHFLQETYDQESFFGCLCPDGFCVDNILTLQEQYGLAKDELALFQIEYEGCLYCFVICLHPDEAKRTSFLEAIKDLMLEKRKKQESSALLRISLPRPTIVLDPRLGTDRTSSTLIKMLYEGLMRLGPQGIPTHAVADEVRISDNGRLYTFYLRQTLWSNGQQVTAHDFEYAWKKILDPSFKTTFHYLFHPIKNARLVKEGKVPINALGVSASSDRILVVELERPTPHFLELCCLWIYSPLCKEVDKAHPGWAYYGDRSYACNGPFKLNKWSKQTGVHVAKNELYWDRDHVCLDKIDISIIEDPIQAIKMFEEGDLDWIGEPLSEVPSSLIKQKTLPLHSQPLSAVQWYFLNTKKSPFSSQKIREAFSLALDREEIIRECLFGDERASKSVLPSSMSLVKNPSTLSYNPVLAKKLFEEGLSELGLTSATFRPIKMVVHDQDPHRSVATAITRFWEKTFGISTIIDAVKWQELFEKIPDATYDVIACAWHSWFHDPLYSLEMLQFSRGPMNASQWENAEFASLVHRASIEEKKEERNIFLKRAETILLQELPIIPLFEYNSRYLKSEEVDHIYVSHMGSVDFKWTSRTQTPSSTQKSKASHQDEIRLYLQTEPLSLDPRIGGNHFSQILLQGLFEGLTRRARDGTTEFALAQSLSLSRDGKLYTFTLRPAKWSNGDEVTAYDFETTWKELLNPSTAIPTAYTHTLFLIRNARKARFGEISLDEVGIYALDAKTLQIRLEHPAPFFLELLSNPFFSPVHKKHAKSTDWSTKTFPEYVCNGPYVLKERQPRSYIVFEKNPFYWNQNDICTSKFRFTIIEDPRVAYSFYKAGELDWYGGPFGNPALEPFQDAATERLSHREADGLYWIACRTNVHHLASQKVRQALAMAIDRKTICDALEGSESPANSLVRKTSQLLQASVFEDNNPEKALRLFEEGIQELGYSKENYPVIVINYWDDPTAKTIAKLIQQQWKNRLHIQVEIAFQEWDTYIKKIFDGSFQLVVACWFSWIHDPIYTLEHLKYPDNRLNATAWTSKDYSQMLDFAKEATDQKERDSYLLKAETIALQELPLIPIIHKTFTYTKTPALSGETWLHNGLMALQWLKKDTIN